MEESGKEGRAEWGRQEGVRRQGSCLRRSAEDAEDVEARVRMCVGCRSTCGRQDGTVSPSCARHSDGARRHGPVYVAFLDCDAPERTALALEALSGDLRHAHPELRWRFWRWQYCVRPYTGTTFTTARTVIFEMF